MRDSTLETNNLKSTRIEIIRDNQLCSKSIEYVYKKTLNFFWSVRFLFSKYRLWFMLCLIYFVFVQCVNHNRMLFAQSLSNLAKMAVILVINCVRKVFVLVLLT